MIAPMPHFLGYRKLFVSLYRHNIFAAEHDRGYTAFRVPSSGCVECGLSGANVNPTTTTTFWNTVTLPPNWFTGEGKRSQVSIVDIISTNRVWCTRFNVWGGLRSCTVQDCNAAMPPAS